MRFILKIEGSGEYPFEGFQEYDPSIQDGIIAIAHEPSNEANGPVTRPKLWNLDDEDASVASLEAMYAQAGFKEINIEICRIDKIERTPNPPISS